MHSLSSNLSSPLQSAWRDPAGLDQCSLADSARNLQVAVPYLLMLVILPVVTAGMREFASMDIISFKLRLSQLRSARLVSP